MEEKLFKESFFYEKMDITGLKIKDVVSYVNCIDINSDVFKSNKVHMYVNYWSASLENIEIAHGIYIEDIPVSEEYYIRFMCPIKYVQADVGSKGKNGFINGIIKPDIIKDNIPGSIPKISSETPQRFHFYYDSLDKKLLGLSKPYKGKQLIVQFMEWNNIDYEKFREESMMKYPKSRVPTEFEVKLNYNQDSDLRKYGHFLSVEEK